jgi:hypothetical protein
MPSAIKAVTACCILIKGKVLQMHDGEQTILEAQQDTTL